MTNSLSTLNSTEDKRMLRRLELLQKAGLFDPLPAGITMKRATSVEEYREALALVYESYVEQAFIISNSSGLRVRPWETFPQNGLFICRTADNVVGVTATVMDNEDILLPSDSAFHDELNHIRDEGCAICEISSQAISMTYRNTPVVTELMRAVYSHAWRSDATDLVCAVSPKQRNFFALMGFKQVGEIKSYSDVVFDPVALLRLENIPERYNDDQPGHPDIKAFWNRFFFTENPYISVFPLWQRMVDVMFSRSSDIESLFQGCTELFANCSESEWSVLEKNLGPAFKALTANMETEIIQHG